MPTYTGKVAHQVAYHPSTGSGTRYVPVVADEEWPESLPQGAQVTIEVADTAESLLREVWEHFPPLSSDRPTTVKLRARIAAYLDR